MLDKCCLSLVIHGLPARGGQELVVSKLEQLPAIAEATEGFGHRDTGEPA